MAHFLNMFNKEGAMKSDFISAQAQLPGTPVWIWVTVITALMLVALVLFTLVNEKDQ